MAESNGGPPPPAPQGTRRGPLVAVLVIGVGLALAPAVFQMFTRAPEGGRMIEQFRPYMSEGEIARFRAHLARIGAAEAETRQVLPALAPAQVGPASGGVGERFPAVGEFQRRWPTIDDDMGEMLTTMEDNLGRFDGVSSLPPFVAFPWFFVVPGLAAAGLALSVLVRTRGGDASRRPAGSLKALVVLGAGLVAAPAVFQMFERAPGGARMIDEFRPLMTTEKVTTVQGYFLTIGAAEGQLRNEVLPAVTTTSPAPELPALADFVRRWPRISNDMAPMIGTMADNVDNFAAVDALPPFGLFPWFFVAPGLLIAGLVLASRRRGRPLPPAVVSAAGSVWQERQRWSTTAGASR